jgi:hypothetical protein
MTTRQLPIGMTFSQVWKNLRAEGWRAKAQGGLSDITLYYSPAGWGNKSGAVRLTDVFYGANELIQHGPGQGIDAPITRFFL